MKAYLDNAATTRLDPEVLEVMLPYMTEYYGNPSSIHADGRRVRSAIERSRKTIAELLNAAPAEIFFTSGGTEADNMAIRSGVETYGIKHLITSPIEHHAVLHTAEYLSKTGRVKLSFVKLKANGQVDLAHLDQLLSENERSLVSLMHGNNEIGNITDIVEAGRIAKSHNALFHSDTVQTMGHFRHNLQEIPVDFIVGAAHKFNGPKGVGFIYINSRTRINPLLQGGAQERNMRGGTENLYGIVGAGKALDIAYREMERDKTHITGLKKRMIERLRSRIEGIEFNGLSGDMDHSLYTVLSVSLPTSDLNDMLLFNLDIAGIAASGGSACSSGTEIGSHVLMGIQAAEERSHVRFSFGRFTTTDEIDFAVETLEGLFQKETAN